jgi:hypothetical protein
MPFPDAIVAFDILPLELIALLLPQVRAPLRIVVPVPEAPNVGFTVVVLDALSEAQVTAVRVQVFPVPL